jgi:hypothetical protein
MEYKLGLGFEKTKVEKSQEIELMHEILESLLHLVYLFL